LTTRPYDHQTQGTRVKVSSDYVLRNEFRAVGAAQNIIVSGLGVLPIMQAGSWRPMNVGCYVEKADLGPLLRTACGDNITTPNSELVPVV